MSRLEKMAEAGGWPNITADTDEVRGKVLDLMGLLEIVHLDADAIAMTYGAGEPCPFEVGMETIGALALVVQEVRDSIPELEQYADRIGSTLYGIDAVRRQQEKAAA